MQIKDIPGNDYGDGSAFVSVAALREDLDGNRWLDPLAETEEEIPGRSGPLLLIARCVHGFKVGYQGSKDHTWERGPLPDRGRNSHGWYKVVQERTAV